MGHRQQKVSLLVLYFVLAYECLFQLKRSYNEDQHKKNTLANNHHLPVGLGFNKQHPPPHQLRRGIKNKEIKKYQRFPHSKLLKSNHKSIDLHRLVTNYSLHYDNIRKLSGGIIYKP